VIKSTQSVPIESAAHSIGKKMDSLDKQDSLERAKKLIEDNNPTSLRYACLELRYCIESICHAKLKLYEKHLPKSSYETWQPKKILEILQEYDPLVMKDCEIALFKKNPDGSNGDFVMGGKHTNLPMGMLKKHYYKLGRFLHIPTLSQEKNGMMSTQDLKSYLESILPAISATVSNIMDCNFALVAEFKCKDCGTIIIRNVDSLKKNPVAVCANEECKAEYDVTVTEENTIWKRRELDFECPKCKKKNHFGAHFLRDGKIINCFSCSSKYVFFRSWHYNDFTEPTT
jgi:hypothetical protein